MLSARYIAHTAVVTCTLRLEGSDLPMRGEYTLTPSARMLNAS